MPPPRTADRTSVSTAPCSHILARDRPIAALGPSAGSPALLEPEQIALAIQAAAVADEVSGRADDPVAGNDDGHRVTTVGETDGPGRGRPPDLAGELPVGDGLA